VILIMAALGIMSVLRWMQRCQGSASLFDFLHQQRGEHRAPLLGSSRPATSRSISPLTTVVVTVARVMPAGSHSVRPATQNSRRRAGMLTRGLAPR
jgi:hypothetical protein